MANLADSVPYIVAKAQGISDDEALYFLKWAAREFYNRSKAVRQPFELSTQSGVDEYPLPEVPTLRVTDVKLDGKPIWSTSEGYILRVDKDYIDDGEDNLTGVLVLDFDESTCDIPDDVYQKYHNAINYGAMAEVYGSSGRDWYSQREAQNNERRFAQEIARARIDTVRTTAPYGGKRMYAPNAFVGRRYAR